MNTEEIRKAQTTVSAPVKRNVLCGQCHQLIGNTNHVCAPVVIKCYTEAEYNKLRIENERITKERDEKQRSIQALSEQFSELIDERNQLREELEQVKKERDEAHKQWGITVGVCESLCSELAAARIVIYKYSEMIVIDGEDRPQDVGMLAREFLIKYKEAEPSEK